MSNSGTIGSNSNTKKSESTIEEYMPSSTKADKNNNLTFSMSSRRYKKEK